MQDGEVGFVNAVHIAGDRGWHDVGRVSVPDVKDMVPLVVVRADKVTVERYVVTQHCEGYDTLTASEVFARVTCLDSGPFDTEFLAVDGTMQRVEVERVMRGNRQRGDGVGDAVIGRLQRCLAQVLLVARFQHVIWKVAAASMRPRSGTAR